MTPARVAGLLYLLMGIPTVFGLQYVPRLLIVPGDATATADRIRSSEPLFRLGIASEVISAVAFIFVGVAIYRLFKDVDPGLASLMLIFVLLSVPITLVAAMIELGALTLLGGASFLSVIDTAQLDALAYALLRLHSHGLVMAEIFWGLWLLPLAALALRSGSVPRIVGTLLIPAGIAYLVVAATSVLVPQYATLASNVAVLPEAGELGIIIWLLTTRAPAISFARAQAAAAS